MAKGSRLIERTIELTISTQVARMSQKQRILTQTARAWQSAEPSYLYLCKLCPVSNVIEYVTCKIKRMCHRLLFVEE